MSKDFLPTKKGFIKSKVKKKKPTQDAIKSAVDITNAAKHFDLQLSLGPYKVNYFKNGRYLLLGGTRGHVAAFDWLTKDLLCEFNIRETVHAVQWLHVPSMFAVAQKDWVHIYDRQGVELNVIKSMYRSIHLDFLEYYFLLASASDKKYISWKDISIGKDIASFLSKNSITAMKHNRSNGMLNCAHPNGTISLWSPNHNKPAVTMLCHPSSIRGLSVSFDGNYLATSGIDKTVRVWDLRNNYECVKEHKLAKVPDRLCFSQLGILAIASGNTVKMYKDSCKIGSEIKPYLEHKVGGVIEDLYYSNYEDVLGVGHQKGFTSLLVPGSGEPNFDSYEANPFMSKTQQKELEIKLLLDKLTPDMIHPDSTMLGKVRKDG